MSDLSIPGVTSKYNTEKSIQALVETERIPLKRLEAERQILQDQRGAWLNLNQRMNTVREGARELYGFQNPFNNKLADSSDQSILTATAARTAQEDKVDIRVKQVAAADRFLSRSLPRDQKAPAGLYRFTIGTEEVKVNFRGGTLRELAAAINARGGKLLAASVVEDTPTTQVLVIESKKTGAANPLGLHDQAAAFAVQIGLLERSPTAGRALPISPQSLAAGQGATIAEGVLTPRPRRGGPPARPAWHHLERHHGAFVRGQGYRPARGGVGEALRPSRPGHPGNRRHRLQGHPRGERPIAHGAARLGTTRAGRPAG